MEKKKKNKHSSTSNKLKIYEPLISESENNLISINKLNDDCLIYIFQNLFIKERIQIECVSKRWNRVSKESWNDIKYFDISEYNPIFIKNNENNTSIFNQILDRCGKYLKDVCVNVVGISHLKLTNVIEDLAKKCSNITDLSISHAEDMECDNALAALFANNDKLESIYFLNLTLTGKCFEKLPARTMKSITLSDCFAIEPKYILNSIPNLNNLVSLKLRRCKGILKSVINALTLSTCQLLELELLGLKEFYYNDQLLSLIKKQKNLQILFLQNFSINRECLINLTDCISKISFIDCSVKSKDLLCSFPSYKILSELRIYLETIDDDFARALTFCNNLKNLSLPNVYFSSLTSTGENYFKALVNLEEILIVSNEGVTDSFLKALSHCKNLTVVEISYCQNITDTGLGYITALSNLKKLVVSQITTITDKPLNYMPKIEYLDCSFCAGVKNDGLINLIKTSHGLNYIDLYGCEILAVKKLINAAIEIKRNTMSHTKLTITVQHSVINSKDIKNLPNLLDIKIF